MTYNCFLCNEYHEDSPTEEHFIPRAIDGPRHQWLPVCEASNTKSNSVFDSKARDLTYYVRYLATGALKRSGEALLADGNLKTFKFSYDENTDPNKTTAFHYLYDPETNVNMERRNVYAIAFPVGFKQDEIDTFCRGLAKISIGALAFLLRKKGNEETIRQIFAQDSVEAIRHFSLALPWSGSTTAMKFSLGRSNVLERLHNRCENSNVRNHVIEISFLKNGVIRVEGMLYSQYGWKLDLSNQVEVAERQLRLENPIPSMVAPDILQDLSLSPDAISIVNPDYIGEIPDIAEHWKPKF